MEGLLLESISELGEVGFLSSNINSGFIMLPVCSVIFFSNFILPQMSKVPLPEAQIMSFTIYFLSTHCLTLVWFNKANSSTSTDVFMLPKGVDIAQGRKTTFFLVVVYVGHIVS